jgi:HEAT repeat protein
MAQKVPFKRVLDALLDNSTAFPARYLSHFSDLAAADLKSLMSIWPQVPVSRKQALLKNLGERYENDTLLSFDDFARALFGDADAEVRRYAVHLVWESEDPRLIPPLLDILQNDPNEEARAEAASVLGRYVYLGELEELREDLNQNVQEALLAAAAQDEMLLVKRKAVEALGFSSRPEVPALIQSAFERRDPRWIASSLFAMGRSGDQRWEEQIIGALSHVDVRIRLAAVEAAGELALANARTILLAALDTEDNEDVHEAVIWSLSQIGGEDVRTYLESLLDATEDDEQAELIEDALDNLTFTEDMAKFDLLAFDPDDELEE